jgi:hypothetical protein
MSGSWGVWDWDMISKIEGVCPKMGRKEIYQNYYDMIPREVKTQKVLEMLNKEPYILIENSFPYHVAGDVKHLVLFINPSYLNNEVKIGEILRNHISVPFVYCYNEVDNRSIPDIPHYHVFVRIE